MTPFDTKKMPTDIPTITTLLKERNDARNENNVVIAEKQQENTALEGEMEILQAHLLTLIYYPHTDANLILETEEGGDKVIKIKKREKPPSEEATPTE